MKGIYYQCFSLTSLPEISKWNIQNLVDVSYMFYNCKGLTPSDKNKLDISKIKEKTSFFEGYLPNPNKDDNIISCNIKKNDNVSTNIISKEFNSESIIKDINNSKENVSLINK